MKHQHGPGVEVVARGGRERCPTCKGDGDVEAGAYGYVECFSCDGEGRTLVVRFRSDRSGEPRVYLAPSRALLEISECEDDAMFGELGRLPEVSR